MGEMAASSDKQTGTLYVVGTPIGNLEDMTFRAVRILREVATIAAEDTRVTAKLLARYEIATRTMSYHRHSGPGREAQVVALLRAGKDVALVSDAGMPGISDPGQGLIAACVAADIPVVQLAVQPERGTAHHVAMGRALAPLRDENVLIIGSGHATHNLRDWIGHRGQADPMRYAVEFSQWLQATLAAHDEQALVDYRDRAPSAARAHPTEEHFLPLFVAYGAAGRDAVVERVVDGFENGALARDSFLLGA
jgi:hypothetical protein